MSHWSRGGFPRYVSQAERKRKAERLRQAEAKRGIVLRPVACEGRAIARSFWGRSWCDNLESYASMANRLDRGRTYVRNGSVIDLVVERGRVRAQVVGSEPYRVEIGVKPLAAKAWAAVVERCAGEVGSVVEVLQGRLPTTLLALLADPDSGLFPPPDDLDFECSCPDFAKVCKHVAAALYGVGARLDHEPGTFFLLRGVEVTDLATRGAGALAASEGSGAIATDELGALFGIELDTGSPAGAVVEPALPGPVAAGPKRKGRAPASPTKPPVPSKPLKKPASPKAKALPARLGWSDLHARGADDATISDWVRRGIVGPPDARARYATTKRTAAALAKLAPPRPGTRR